MKMSRSLGNARAPPTNAKQGLATYTIYIIIVSVLILVVVIVVFSNWVPPFKEGIARTSCAFKRANYCWSWKANGYDPNKTPFNWNDKPPTDCDQLEITKPKSKEDCEG